MSKLLVPSKAVPDKDGNTIKITPESANWKYIGFEVYKLKKGEFFQTESKNKELAIVLVTGRANVFCNENNWENIGERMDVFEKKPAYTVYVSVDDKVKVEAVTDLEIAVCSSSGNSDFETRLFTPNDVKIEKKGNGTSERDIHNILMDKNQAHSLFILEVYTPEGRWSSYPPHRHENDNYPDETYLEETYYHKHNPKEGGFSIQRVYTDDRALDETIVVTNEQVVLVPQGYHPVSAPPGYEVYNLCVMSGPIREWKFVNDKDHEWLIK